MPFTISHAAAVLPLRGAGLSASALIIGSLAPDVPLFLPFLPVSVEQTHTAGGLLSADLVVGAVMFLVWHGFLARPALWFAPTGLRARIGASARPGLRQRVGGARAVGLVALSLVLGAATHQFWDLFTHEGTLVTGRYGLLDATAWGMPLPEVLQYGSSVAGLLVVGGWFVRWWRAAPVQPVLAAPPRLGRYSVRAWVVGMAFAGVPIALALAGWEQGAGSPTTLYAVSVVPVVLGLGAAMVVAAGWHVHRGWSGDSARGVAMQPR